METYIKISGGYADVFIDKINNKVYKTFNRNYSRISHRDTSWIKEIIFISQLNHPNIIKKINFNSSKKSEIIITYPYYHCIKNKKKYNDEEIFICLLGLFSGLEYCHSM